MYLQDNNKTNNRLIGIDVSEISENILEYHRKVKY